MRQSGHGDGASAATKNLRRAMLRDESRYFAEPVLSEAKGSG
jgi:hypothetical protein